MTKNFRLYIIFVILLVELFWPLSILFPSSIEASEIVFVDKGLKSDFSFFMRRNGYDVAVARTVESNLIIGHIFGMYDLVNIVNESGTKLSGGLVKFGDSDCVKSSGASRAGSVKRATEASCPAYDCTEESGEKSFGHYLYLTLTVLLVAIPTGIIVGIIGNIIVRITQPVII
jgi:hypothetical protein